LVPLKIVFNVSINKPALNWNRFSVNLRRSSNSLNSDLELTIVHVYWDSLCKDSLYNLKSLTFYLLETIYLFMTLEFTIQVLCWATLDNLARFSGLGATRRKDEVEMRIESEVKYGKLKYYRPPGLLGWHKTNISL